ncbi:RAD54 homolog B [Homo sapiens]|uniref:Isoform 2 of DNA repair and recombination protein RAD54B n=1 Tax=Homo sapiens TaxID=9606 RepID=Q9Y620-2|nr:DNA repair and recombination protein RAD54B isoform 2 [Homo sapiens]KAI2550716.1 RAD54-like B [Homo sapiens]KAI4011357.1 RAD54 homolog B [Homo sapiens]|eukprot:NP_001192191.1 DNA repair and recombination protein RAD54B isoform 2 [Homo sapiens]
MRRSAAPSQLQGNSFKKPKFIPPGRSNPGLNEEITKLNPDIKLFEGVAINNTFLPSQNDLRICSLNLPSEESTREINNRDNCSGKYCFEAPTLATLDPPHTVQTWMRRHRLVPVHYR